MFTNNRSLERDDKSGFGERPRITNEINELCRIFSEQRSATDGFSGIPLNASADLHQCSKQKIKNSTSPEKNENLVNIRNLNSIPLEPTNSSNFLHSEATSGNHRSKVENCFSSLPCESNLEENERSQRNQEFTTPKIYKLLNNNCTVVHMESNRKTLPLVAVSNNQFGPQDLDTSKHFERRSHDASASKKVNIICSSDLKNGQFSSGSSLQSNLFSGTEFSNEIQRTISNSSRSLTSMNKLFQGNHFYTEKQNALSFNSMEFQNDNSLCKTFLCKENKLTEQYPGLKYNPEKGLDIGNAENKLISFNFSLQLKNQPKDNSVNLYEKKASKTLSAPCNSGSVSNSERNCFFVQTKWRERKCKSEVQILQETESLSKIKFDSNCKNLYLDSNFNILQKTKISEESSKSGNSSKPKHIPTFRGHKFPTKVSVLMINSPILLNYTENISGKSQEILMCTSDDVNLVIKNKRDVQHKEIIKRLFVKSRPYIGKPIHIIFEPRKIAEPFSVDERNSIPLRASPGKYDLLDQQHKGPTSAFYKVNNETDPDRNDLNWESSSVETLVAKQNDSQGMFDSTAHQDTSRCDRCEEKKVKIKLCQRKKSRTDLKRVNVKQIVNSVFRNFFHFYSVLGGQLRSGSVITKSNSIIWLREAGVATDARSVEAANELFKDIAGAKVVLNIFDFMQFLIKFARMQRVDAVDVIRQLTICKLPKASRFQKDRRKSEASRRNISSHSEQESVASQRSQSLPNLKNNPSIFYS